MEKGVSFERKKQKQPGRIKIIFGKYGERRSDIVERKVIYEYWLKQWNMTEPVIKVPYTLRSQERAGEPDYWKQYENYK